MSVVKAINTRAKSSAALSNTLDYIYKDKKVTEELKLVTAAGIIFVKCHKQLAAHVEKAGAFVIVTLWAYIHLHTERPVVEVVMHLLTADCPAQSAFLAAETERVVKHIAHLARCRQVDASTLDGVFAALIPCR